MSDVPADSLQTLLRECVLAPLDRLRRVCRLYLALDGMVRLGLTVVCAGAAQFALDRWLKLGVDQRAAISLAVAGLWLWLLYRSLLRPLLRPLSDGWLAKAVDRAHPELHDGVVTAVELAPAEVAPAASRLVHAAVRDACDAAGGVSFLDVLNHRRARRRAFQLLGVLLVVAAVALAAPGGLRIWFQRNWRLQELPWPQWTYIRPVGFDEAGQRRVPRGDELEIVAIISGRTPKVATLYWKTASDRAGRESMTLVGGKRLRTSLGVLSEDVRFHIVGGDERTREYVVQAVARPAVIRTQVRITPPTYTGQEPITLEQQTVLEVLTGSTLEIKAWLNKPVRRAEFVGADGPVAVCEQEGLGLVRVVWPGPTPGSYHFALTDADGWDNRHPVRYTLKVVADEPPEVRMELPDVGAYVTPQAELPIRLRFRDAYGLGSVALRVQRGDEPAYTVPPEGFRPLRRQFQTTIDYTITSIGILAGQRLRLWAEAHDRDPRGPNLGRTEPFELRVVTQEEFLEEMGRREYELRREFEHVLSAQRALKDALEQVQSRLPDESPITPAVAQQISGLSRRQDSHAGRCLTLRARFVQILAEMRTSRAARAVEERRLSDRIITPLEALGTTILPAAANAMAELRESSVASRRQAVLVEQEEILRQMQTVLAAMLKREGYREAVALLQEVIDQQTEVRTATLEALQRELEAILGLGESQESSPPKPPGP